MTPDLAYAFKSKNPYDQEYASVIMEVGEEIAVGTTAIKDAVEEVSDLFAFPSGNISDSLNAYLMVRNGEIAQFL